MSSSVFDSRSLAASGSTVSSTDTIRRTNMMLWCARHSRTYVLLELGRLVAGDSIPTTISIAHNVIATRIRSLGDGLIDHGRFSMVGLGGVGVDAWNADNHQLTWGVLGEALTALLDYMRIYGNGAITFNIFDGAHMVGQGTVQITR